MGGIAVIFFSTYFGAFFRFTSSKNYSEAKKKQKTLPYRTLLCDCAISHLAELRGATDTLRNSKGPKSLQSEA